MVGVFDPTLRPDRQTRSLNPDKVGLEARGGFEPPNGGFADLSLRPLGYRAVRTSIRVKECKSQRSGSAPFDFAPFDSLCSLRVFDRVSAALRQGRQRTQRRKRREQACLRQAGRQECLPHQCPGCGRRRGALGGGSFGKLPSALLGAGRTSKPPPYTRSAGPVVFRRGPWRRGGPGRRPRGEWD